MKRFYRWNLWWYNRLISYRVDGESYDLWGKPGLPTMQEAKAECLAWWLKFQEDIKKPSFRDTSGTRGSITHPPFSASIMIHTEDEICVWYRFALMGNEDLFLEWKQTYEGSVWDEKQFDNIMLNKD